jgi:hypothetical protein
MRCTASRTIFEMSGNGESRAGRFITSVASPPSVVRHSAPSNEIVANVSVTYELH